MRPDPETDLGTPFFNRRRGARFLRSPTGYGFGSSTRGPAKGPTIDVSRAGVVGDRLTLLGLLFCCIGSRCAVS